MGISIIYLFIQICELLDVPHKYLLSVGLMIHPIFLINATSTMDYLWALCFLVFGYYEILKGNVLISGISFGVAVGFRSTSALFVIALFLSTLIISETRSRDYLLSMVIGGVVGVLWYIPVLVYADFNILYLHPSLEPGTPASNTNNWGLFETIGRFGYKQIFFWGLPTTILGVASIPYLFTGIKEKFDAHKQSIVQSIFIILSTEVIFLRAPLDPAYLLPMLPFVLIIIGTVFDKNSIFIFLLFILSFNFVSIDFICFGSFESPLADMNVGIYIDPGFTVYDTTLRFNNETRGYLNYFGACGRRIVQLL